MVRQHTFTTEVFRGQDCIVTSPSACLFLTFGIGPCMPDMTVVGGYRHEAGAQRTPFDIAQCGWIDALHDNGYYAIERLTDIGRTQHAQN